MQMEQHLIKNDISRLTHILDRINKTTDPVCIIDGAEFNVGQDIIEWGKLSRLKWKLYGVHGWFINKKEISLDNLKSLYSKDGCKFNAWAHIERELHKIDHGRFGSTLTCEIKEYLDWLVVLAKKQNIYLELNETSLIDDEGGGRSRIEYWLKSARENGNKISLGTDAHYCEEIGHFNNAIAMLNELNYPKDDIVNCNLDILRNLS